MYTRTHEILRPIADAQSEQGELKSSSGGAGNDEGSVDFVSLRVGLTDRTFDLIGDVKGIGEAVSVGDTVNSHENMLLLSWEGFTRTASDELYHAVWANTEGVRKLSLPFQSQVVGFNDDALSDPYMVVGPSEKGWIAQIKVSRQVLEQAVENGQVMGEEKYQEMCDAEEEEEFAAASRAYP